MSTSNSPEKSFKLFIAQNVVWLILALVIVGGGFARDWITNKIRFSEFTVHQLTKDSTRDLEINKLLNTVLIKVSADRSYVFRLHNGGQFAGGIPFKKTSCTQEIVELGVSQELNNQQNIPLSSVPELTDMLTRHNCTFLIDVDTLPSGPFKALLKSQAIKKAYIHRIMKNNEIWGFIGVDYLRNETIGFDSNIFDTYAHLIELEVTRDN